MADSKVNPSPSHPQPVFEYTIRQRAALQLLSDAMRHVAKDPDRADIEAAWMLWGFREVIALDGMKLRSTPKLKPGPLSIVWRNPQAGAL